MSRALVAALCVDPTRIVLSDTSQRLSAAQVLAAVEHDHRWLTAAGATRHALLADNGIGWALADLTLYLHGRLSVPLPAHFSDAQLCHALDDAGIDGVLTDRPERVLALPGTWRHEGVAPQSGLTLLKRRFDADRVPALPPGTIKVTYTSGSTSAPKGVCLSAAQLEAVVTSLVRATAADRITLHHCVLPLATLLENIAGLYAPLRTGARCHVPRLAEIGIGVASADPSRLLGSISMVGPSSLVLVPELLNLLTTAAEHGWQHPQALRFVAVGGASVSTELLGRAASCGLPVFEGYGLSECASVVALNTRARSRPGSVGKPLPHVRVHVDACGEIHVSGSTMLGYLGEPLTPGGTWPTGDLGEFDDDGYLYVRGRLRNVFITSYGRNVSPEWIERELAQQPAIRHAFVTGEARPYAVAVLSAVPDAPHEALARAVDAANARLPEYARVRRWIRAAEGFAFDDGMLTANGRMRRDAVLRRHGAQLDALYREPPIDTRTLEHA